MKFCRLESKGRLPVFRFIIGSAGHPMTGNMETNRKVCFPIGLMRVRYP